MASVIGPGHRLLTRDQLSMLYMIRRTYRRIDDRRWYAREHFRRYTLRMVTSDLLFYVAPRLAFILDDPERRCDRIRRGTVA